jgi:signal transduction histidine kinase
MLVLVPVLAVLQYRWIGQLSDAERDRMQRSLRVTTSDFVSHMDLELARIAVGLQVDAASVRARAWDRYADRVLAWREAATDPALVQAILLVEADPADDEALRVSRWSQEHRAFEPATWPADLQDVAARVGHAYHEYREQPDRLFGRPLDTLAPGGRALMFPWSQVQPLPADGSVRLRRAFGYIVVQLDPGVLERHILPETVARHFGPHGMGDYHLAVLTRDGPPRVIFESEPGDARALAGRADVDQPFFGLGPEQYPLLRQAAAMLRPVPMSDNEPRRGVFFNVFGRRGGGPGDKPTPGEGMRWRLLVGHRAGSLEAAVAGARRRNVALSSGILVLMAASVVLIVIAARRAQHLARQQIEFVAGVSHELRTPVAVIGAAADNLAQGVVQDPARIRQYGTTIRTEARRLAETVDRVLEYAGIQAGAVRPVSRCSPRTLVDEAIAASRGLVDEAGAVITVECAPDVPDLTGDAVALRSVAQNLVANAIKYGGPKPSVRIVIGGGASRRDREVVIRVEDHGIGIPPAELAQIFDPFYRGTNAVAHHIHGSGLGLSIVRHIVEAHGGRVTATSTPGRGSTFTVVLPAGPPAAAQPAASTVGVHREALP